MENTITIRDMLDDIEAGLICSIVVITYDRKRNTGGKVKHYPEIMIYREGMELGRPLTEAEQKQFGQKKAPRHGKHYTRNMVIMQNGTPTSIIRKIHPPLVMKYNGKTVLD